MELIIRPLTKELITDYLDFFDHTAFSDDNPNGPCYCTSPSQDEETIQKMVSEFAEEGVKETLRRYAIELLNTEKIKGYLAYDGDNAVGWCNAADMDHYLNFVPNFAREIICGKTISIVCFEIAPKYRGKGIATALIEKICKDGQAQGYRAVEGYPKFMEERDDYDYNGPVLLYERVGFKEIHSQDGQLIMRKLL